MTARGASVLSGVERARLNYLSFAFRGFWVVVFRSGVDRGASLAQRECSRVFRHGRKFSAVMIAWGLRFLAGECDSRHEGAFAGKERFQAVLKLCEV